MKYLRLLLTILCAGSTTLVNAQDIQVSVTNLTQGIYFTPILVTAHDGGTQLFEAGAAASAQLQAMAEGGDLAGLIADLDAIGAVSVTDPAGGLLAPATSTSTEQMDTGEMGYLSVVAMMLPTNDGFMGTSGWPIPAEAGSYTLWLNAWDAGTEANDELVTGGGAPGAAGIPANPGGNGGSEGTGVTDMETTQTVHVHRGNLGDVETLGGNSDVDSRIHRWLNPVAKVVVTVN